MVETTPTINSRVDVRVVKDDERRVAARLDRNSANNQQRFTPTQRIYAHFLRVVAAKPARSFATGVLPVNETFLTAVFWHISRPTSTTFACIVTTLITPGGTPARVASWNVC